MKSALKSLYSVRVLGYILKLVAAFARLPQMRESHDSTLAHLAATTTELHRTAGAQAALLAGASAAMDAQSAAIAEAGARIAGQQSAIAGQQSAIAGQQNAIADAAARIDDQRAALAAHDAQVHRHLEAIDETMHAQGALLSTVQRLSNDVKAAIERDFAGVLNAVTIQQATTRSYGATLESVDRRIQDVLGTQETSTDRLVKRCEALAADVIALRDELWARAGALEGELTKRAQQIDKLSGQAIPPAALASAGTLESLENSVKYLLERVEFVRRETLFEVRYGHQPGAEHPLDVKARVINAKKVGNQGKRGMRLNVGCGHITFDDFVNVDRRELPGVDVVAEAGSLPFEPGSVTEIFSAHLLEHFPQEQLRREILPFWKSLLKPGGRLRAVVPDAEAMIREYGAGNMSYGDLREVTFGSQDYEGDFHYNMFTPESLSQLLREVGFTTVEVPERARRNGQCFEFEVVAS